MRWSGDLSFDDDDIDEEDFEEEEEEKSPEELIDLAHKALERMSEEWLQNEFGTEIADVIFDALNLFIEEKRK